MIFTFNGNLCDEKGNEILLEVDVEYEGSDVCGSYDMTAGGCTTTVTEKTAAKISLLNVYLGDQEILDKLTDFDKKTLENQAWQYLEEDENYGV